MLPIALHRRALAKCCSDHLLLEVLYALHVAVGILGLLVATWAITLAINALPFTFPPAVVALALFLIALLLLRWFTRMPNARVDLIAPVLRIVDPPCSFTLKNMGLLFTPGFVELPKRTLLPNRQIGLVTATFVITGLIALVGGVMLVRAVRLIPILNQRKPLTEAEAEAEANFDLVYGSPVPRRLIWLHQHEAPRNDAIFAPRRPSITSVMINAVFSSPAPSIHNADPEVGVNSRRIPALPEHATVAAVVADHASRPASMRGADTPSHSRQGSIDMLGPRSRQCSVDRLGAPGLSPLALARVRTSDSTRSIEAMTARRQSAITLVEPDMVAIRRTMSSPAVSKIILEPPSPTLPAAPAPAIQFVDPFKTDAAMQLARMDSASPSDTVVATPVSASFDLEKGEKGEEAVTEPIVVEDDGVDGLAKRYRALLWPTFFVFTTLLGIILYYIGVDALTLHTSISALCWLAATRVVPKRWQAFAHPILTTSFAVLLLIWTLGEIRGDSLETTLNLYSIEAGLVDVWTPGRLWEGPTPGAGDLLRVMLDAGIVALAVPIYRYRHDLRDNAGPLLLNMTVLAACALFVWPVIGAAVGLPTDQALAFVGRFMSAPLAIELEEGVNGNVSLTVVLVITTGIVHVITAPYVFRLLRVPPDDFVVIGMTTGSIAGAIGTSALADRPRALAISTVSFALYGALLLIVVATPASLFITQLIASTSTASA